MTITAARTLHSPGETRMVGLALGRALRGGDVVLLEGMLGAGKTTLVRSVVEGMGLDAAAVSSPTFVVIHEYGRGVGSVGGVGGVGPDLIHVDAYRLHGSEELDSLGWDRVLDRLREGSAALVIEWPERLEGAMPGEPARARLEHVDEHRRELFLELPDSWRSREGLSELLDRRATTCPVTGAPVPADSPTYPFASERARLAELYKWFSGSYQISRELSADDLEEPPPGE